MMTDSIVTVTPLIIGTKKYNSLCSQPYNIMENKHGKTRGHPYKITKLHSRLDIRKYSFTQRMVNDWNRLPRSAVMSTSVNQFKGNIDK